jgi:hypothetical protein
MYGWMDGWKDGGHMWEFCLEIEILGLVNNFHVYSEPVLKVGHWRSLDRSQGRRQGCLDISFSGVRNHHSI